MPLPGASNTSRVSVAHDLGVDATVLLERALAESGFWTCIANASRRVADAGRAFRVLIKPDLGFFDPSGLDGTDPRLVEHLIDLLHDHGHTDVTVGDGRNDSEDWLQNRDPLVLPDLAGYRFVTPRQRAYEIVDLQELAPVANLAVDPTSDPPNDTPLTPPDSDAAAAPIGRHWQDAAFRISFAKNKTHEDTVFALCVRNLLGVVPTVDAHGQLRPRRPEDDCLQVLRRAPPHFNLIDGHTSCHGGAGQRAPRRIETRVIVASASALLADWVGAAKMGVDPHASPVNSVALKALGLPLGHEVIGDLAPYPLWRNVHPLIARSARLRSRSDAVGRIAAAWFQRVDRERFPLRDFYNDRINAVVAPLMAQVDDNPRSFGLIVLLNWVISRLDLAILTQRTLYAKQKLPRRVAPLTIDLASHPRADYTAIADHLRPLEALLDATPSHRLGFRWRHLDGSILFGCTHEFPIDFDDFTSRVDITRSIQYMNDYIGGSTVAVQRDARGRVVRQAERNLYLPQPNWIVAFGGVEIDVEKLECIRYTKDQHSIHWRTVASPNQSALHDDGRVTFQRTGRGATTVSLFARQQFKLPLFFQVFDVDLLPGVRDPLIESAYSAFFTGTIANLQAAYDGREFRIGREAAAASDTPSGPPDLARTLATAAAAGLELLRQRRDWTELGLSLFDTGHAAAQPTGARSVDHHGFTHVSPATGQYPSADAATLQAASGLAALVRDAPDFLTGLAEALHNDLARIADAEPGTRSP